MPPYLYMSLCWRIEMINIIPAYGDFPLADAQIGNTNGDLRTKAVFPGLRVIGRVRHLAAIERTLDRCQYPHRSEPFSQSGFLQQDSSI